ncbi:hypothetical protein V565_352230, partial [Rhizoctonia solani 123E]
MPKSNCDPNHSTATVEVANSNNGPDFNQEPKYTFTYSVDGKYVCIKEVNGKKHVYSMIAKPENPGKCVLEEEMHMPKGNERHKMYLIFDSMRSNARQVLGKDGLDILWSSIPIEVRADILNMVAGGGNEILIRILRNARDQAMQNRDGRKAKTMSKVNKKATNQVESSKESSTPNQSSSSKSKSTDKDDLVVRHTAPSKGDNNTTNKKSALAQPVDESGDPDESTQKALACKHPILRQPRKDRDLEDIFTVTWKTKEELVEAIDMGGSER